MTERRLQVIPEASYMLLQLCGSVINHITSRQGLVTGLIALQHTHQAFWHLPLCSVTCWCAEDIAMLALQLDPSASGVIEQSQLQAASQLMRLAESSPQHQDAIVAAGAVPKLAAWLISNQDKAQTHGIALLVRLTESKHSTDAFMSAGIVPKLTSLLDSAQSEVQSSAAATIGMTARVSQQLCDAIIAAGALPKLADLFGSDQPAMQIGALLGFTFFFGSQQDVCVVQVSHFLPACISMLMSENLYVQELAAGAIEIITLHGEPAQCDAVITAGALPLLIAKLQSPQTELQITAATVLATFASFPKQNQTVAVVSSTVAEALPAVAAILQSDATEFAAKDAALYLVTCLADRSQQIRDRIVSSGMIPILIAPLSSNFSRLQNQAAEALGNIAAGSQASKDAVVDSGALPLLATLLMSGQQDGRSAAADACAELAHKSPTTGEAIIAAGILPALA